MSEPVRARAYEPVPVEINGSLFESVDPTEAAQEKLNAAGEAINALLYEAQEREKELDDKNELLPPDEQKKWDDRLEKATREYRLVFFDMVLRPVEGGKQKASTVLKNGLKSGEITPREYEAYWREIPAAIGRANGVEDGEAEEATRPT